MKKCAAEFFGTFCLVFAGTGAIVVNQSTAGTISHAGIALTFGLIVVAMFHSVGDVSGAHLNPAVTLGFFGAGRFGGHLVLPYIISQAIGASAASATLHQLFPDSRELGMTIPAGASRRRSCSRASSRSF